MLVFGGFCFLLLKKGGWRVGSGVEIDDTFFSLIDFRVNDVF